jgi:membrane protein YqaA with SNARE-associated domain
MVAEPPKAILNGTVVLGVRAPDPFIHTMVTLALAPWTLRLLIAVAATLHSMMQVPIGKFTVASAGTVTVLAVLSVLRTVRPASVRASV